jgi:hypothetical protein
LMLMKLVLSFIALSSLGDLSVLVAQYR